MRNYDTITTIQLIMQYINACDYNALCILLETKGTVFINSLDSTQLMMIKDCLDSEISSNPKANWFYVDLIGYDQDIEGTKEIKRLLIKLTHRKDFAAFLRS